MMGIRAGLLNEVIVIYKPNYQVNEFGEKVQTYEKKYTTRANVEHTSGNRTIENQEIFYGYKKAFRIRSYVPVVENDIVEYDSKRYRIMSIDNKIKINNEKIILTELINE